MHPLPTPRRVSPALVAVVAVFAIMAGTMGYLGTRKIITSQATGPAATSGPGHPAGPGATSSPGRTSGPGGTANPGGTSNPGGPPASSPPPVDPQDPGTFCPTVTEKAVVDANLGGALTLVLYVDVAAPGNSPGLSPAEAWVCRNSDGVLIYQGHVKSGPFSVANSDSSILIAEGMQGTVVPLGVGFLATNPNPRGSGATTYLVTRASLLLTKPDGSATEYPVVRAYP